MDHISQLFFLKGALAVKAKALLATPAAEPVNSQRASTPILPLPLQDQGGHRLGSHVLHLCFASSLVILEVVCVHLVLVIQASHTEKKKKNYFGNCVSLIFYNFTMSVL